MKINNLQKNKGFVLLFAVTVSSILLAIALGVANIALKEVRFSTSARDTNDAFFAADTGIEYTLFNDRTPAFYPPGLTAFDLAGFGASGQSCAKVTVNKSITPSTTTIIAKGYNIGGSAPGIFPASCTPPASAIERELNITY